MSQHRPANAREAVSGRNVVEQDLTILTYAADPYWAPFAFREEESHAWIAYPARYMFRCLVGSPPHDTFGIAVVIS